MLLDPLMISPKSTVQLMVCGPDERRRYHRFSFLSEYSLHLMRCTLHQLADQAHGCRLVLSQFVCSCLY